MNARQIALDIHHAQAVDSDARAALQTLIAHLDALLAERQEIGTLSRYEGALRSIAANSCCDRCQEAALVARVALADPGRPPQEDSK